jgi:two-component system sensor histidine kinase KdpD
VEKARELGAEVVRLKSDDPAQALLDFARTHGIAHVIVGRSLQHWWKQILRGSVLTRLLREGKDFDLHVVASNDEERA